MLIFDSDVLIDYGRDVEIAVNVVDLAFANSSVAISAVTKMELMMGCRNKIDLKEIFGFTSRFELLHVNEAISDLAIQLLEKYRLSHGLMMPDSFIAATAIVNQSPLISKNQRDFQFIQGLNLPAYP